MITKRKQSFLEHLTGSHTITENDEEFDEELSAPIAARRQEEYTTEPEQPEEAYDEEDGDDDIPGLAVDMYESENELVLQCMIAGVTPENLHISITRNTVTIEGKRNEPQGIDEEQYIARELYWGQFFREIELPFEIDPDGADAVEKYGLLVIRLHKLDTTRIQELKVKSI